MGFILILFVIGDGLIYIIFGRNAAIMGFICLLAAFVPMILILISLWMIEWIAKRNNQD
jgi:hypothetical protein